MFYLIVSWFLYLCFALITALLDETYFVHYAVFLFKEHHF